MITTVFHNFLTLECYDYEFSLYIDLILIARVDMWKTS